MKIVVYQGICLIYQLNYTVMITFCCISVGVKSATQLSWYTGSLMFDGFRVTFLIESSLIRGQSF